MVYPKRKEIALLGAKSLGSFLVGFFLGQGEQTGSHTIFLFESLAEKHGSISVDILSAKIKEKSTRIQQCRIFIPIKYKYFIFCFIYLDYFITYLFSVTFRQYLVTQIIFTTPTF